MAFEILALHVIDDVLLRKTLQKECQWNTELTLRFVELTSQDHELFYMVQTSAKYFRQLTVHRRPRNWFVMSQNDSPWR